MTTERPDDLHQRLERNRRMGRRGMLAVVGAAGVAALVVSCATSEPEMTARGSAPSSGAPGQGGAG
jgi:hypothetical protein